MKRRVAFLLGLFFPLAGFLIGPAPKAEATGVAVCAITGTIKFTASATTPTQGTWSIEPAVITCQGIFRGYEYITGPGAFRGSGTYRELPGGPESCLQRVGSGELDYMLPTTEADVRMREPHQFVMAGAGTFTSPSLNGSSQIVPPFDGDCMTRPVTRATFVAETLLARVSGLGF